MRTVSTTPSSPGPTPPRRSLPWKARSAAIRTTPSFSTPNGTDPAIKFNDSLFEPFNAPGGSVTKSFTNLFQFRENVSFTTAHHSLKAGGELRLWRDSSYFGMAPNGEYGFGGGTAYSSLEFARKAANMMSTWVILYQTRFRPFLPAAPSPNTRAVAPSYFSNGERIGPAADSRDSYEAYLQDVWKVTPRLVLNYDLRFELYTALSDRGGRASGFYPAADGGQQFLVSPKPASRTWMNNWGPRVQADYRFTDRFRGHDHHTPEHLAG